MTDNAAARWEDDLIADIRAHGGAVTAGPLAGHPLLIMTSTGARTGESRRAILTFSRDGGDYVVAGTQAGHQPIQTGCAMSPPIRMSRSRPRGELSRPGRRLPTRPTASGYGTSTSRRSRTLPPTRSRPAG